LLASEFATLGFYISGHPLSKHAARLKDLGVVDLALLEGRRNGEEITVAGIVVSTRPMRSRKGDRWAIVNLQDMTAAAEVLAFPEAYARLEATFKSPGPLVLKARVNVEEVGTRLVVMEARVLEGAPGGVRALRVRVDLAAGLDDFTLDRLLELFVAKPGPCPVVFDLLHADGSAATLRATQRVRLDDDLLVAVRAMCGADAVELDRSAT